MNQRYRKGGENGPSARPGDSRSKSPRAVKRLPLSERISAVSDDRGRIRWDTDLIWYERKKAAENLSCITLHANPPGLREALVKASRDKDWRVRKEAKWGLKRLESTERSEKIKEVKALATAFSSDTDNPAILKQLLKALKYDDGETRMLAARALRNAKSRRATSALKRAWKKDPSCDVRSEAVAALANIKGIQWVTPIVDALVWDLSSADRNTTLYAVRTLGKLAPVAGNEILKAVGPLMRILRTDISLGWREARLLLSGGARIGYEALKNMRLGVQAEAVIALENIIKANQNNPGLCSVAKELESLQEGSSLKMRVKDARRWASK